MGASGLVVVALVVTLVFIGVGGGGTAPTTTETAGPDGGGVIALADDYSLADTPTARVNNERWNSGGVGLYDGVREERYQYTEAECFGVFGLVDDITLDGEMSDEQATIAYADGMLANAQGVGGTGRLEQPTSDGGSVEFVTFEYTSSSMSRWMAARVFAASRDIVLLAVMCTDAGDVERAAADFRDSISITVPVA